MSLSQPARAEIERQRDRYPHARSAILPALWAVQNDAGSLTAEGMTEVAALLQLAPSEVQAVATFYSMYFDKPGGRHHLLVCVNVSCALRGADDIVTHLEHSLGCPSGGTTADGEFTWEATIECLGACGGAPAMQVDHHFHEDLTVDSVDGILHRLREAAPVHAVGNGQPAPEGPHPPAGETPPLASAEGAPADASVAGSQAASPPASADPSQSAADRAAPTPSPKGSKSRSRRSRPQPSLDDL